MEDGTAASEAAEKPEGASPRDSEERQKGFPSLSHVIAGCLCTTAQSSTLKPLC